MTTMKKLPKTKAVRKLPESKKDVHTEHCCVLHGCKYMENFSCPVVQKQKPQSFICETCAHQGIFNLDALRAVLRGDHPRCPHCNHVLP